jgi:hypothetical protein
MNLINDKFLFLLFFTVLTVSCETNTDDDSSNEESSTELSSKFGIWEGVGEQPGISWTIKITLSRSEQLIEYPSLECGGFLTLLEEREGYLLFRETITFNTICADQGFIELVETGANSFDYNYYFPNTSNIMGLLGATGQITKTN